MQGTIYRTTVVVVVVVVVRFGKVRPKQAIKGKRGK